MAMVNITPLLRNDNRCECKHFVKTKLNSNQILITQYKDPSKYMKFEKRRKKYVRSKKGV